MGGSGLGRLNLSDAVMNRSLKFSSLHEIKGDNGGLALLIEDFILNVPPCCQAAVPILQYWRLLKLNWADSGTFK